MYKIMIYFLLSLSFLSLQMIEGCRWDATHYDWPIVNCLYPYLWGWGMDLSSFMLRQQMNEINFTHPLAFLQLFILVGNFMASYDWLIHFSHVYLMSFWLELKFLFFPVKYMTLYFLVPDFILFLLLRHHLVLSYDILILLCIDDTS